jgi:hypothetical protein
MKKRVFTTGITNNMPQLRLVLSALVILWCPFATASQVDFSSTEAFLKSTLKGEDRLSIEARGDLNDDGLEDWAGVIERKKSDDSSTSQLYVLLRRREGGYHVAEKSKEDVNAGTGCCWVESLEIKRSSVYIQNNVKTGNTMEAVTHQFKLHKGEWRLIGLKIYSTDLISDATTETDINLRTGAVIEKRQKGESKPITKSRRQKISIYLLKDFDFSNVFGAE